MMRSNGSRSACIPAAITLLLALCAFQLAACGSSVSFDERIAAGDRAAAAADNRAAIIEFKNALDVDPNNAAARLRLGKALLAIGEVPAAVKELERARALGAQTAEVVSPLVQAYLAGNQGQQVLDLLSQDAVVQAIAPTELLRLRGEALLALDRGEEAEAAFREALNDADRSSAVVAGIIRAQIQQDKLDEARAGLEAQAGELPEVLDIIVLRSELAARAEDLPDAEKHLLEALKSPEALQSSLVRARLLAGLADVRLRMGDAIGAREALTRLREESGESPAWSLLAGRASLAEGNGRDAIDRLQAFVQAVPGSVEGKVMLGVALLAENLPAQALAQLEVARSMAPHDLQVNMALAQAQMQFGNPAEALGILAPFLAQDAPHPQVMALAGRARLALGDAAGSLELLQKGASANPDDPALKLELASAFIADGQHDKALALLQNLQGSGGDESRRQWLTVLIHADRGDRAAAEAALEQLLRGQEHNADLQALAGAFMRRIGRLPEAQRAYERALAADPRSIVARLALAQIAAERGDEGAMIGHYREVLAIDPVNAHALDSLARAELTRGGASAALDVIRTARDRNPRTLTPQLLLVRLLGTLGFRDEAMAEASQLLKLAPADAAAIGTAAAANAQAGRLEEALALYNSALRLNVTPELLLQRGSLEAALGRLRDARGSFEQALALRNDWMPATAALLRLDVQEGKVDAAIARAQAIAKRHPADRQARHLVGETLVLAGRSREAATYFDSLGADDKSAVLRAFQLRVATGLPNPESGLLNVLKGEPDNTALRTALAAWYQDTDRVDDARVQYEEVLKHSQNDVVALNNLAWMLGNAGDGRALEYARRAYELAPTSGPVTDTYGWLLARSDRSEEALPLLRRAAGLLPADPEVQYHYAFALANSGDARSAKALLDRITAGDKPFPSRAEAEALSARLR